MKKLLLPALLSGLMFATSAQASAPTEHFEGEAADTLSQAVANFSETNQQLAELLAQDELSIENLGTIHELTYTLENALEKINEEADAMAVNLEEVHLGSETGDFERVQSHGADYLEAAQTLVP
ncbi:hypothetical protein HNO52_01415 [Billgrantia diversa]|uniref:DUF6746 family protein n=1 Tax=Halomonas sp. MCCC 1A13316 TaxID=2733487 RepID=UPI0018A65CC7|nr:DUF6746 family protein [Halomonas sp. MCCC 1A13316]QOR37314.1 hypothetical protein HNO52_01415 [Halomonas sp. MCCC 1A13316]